MSQVASTTSGGVDMKGSPDVLGTAPMKLEMIPESEDVQTQSSESLTQRTSGSLASIDAQSLGQTTISGAAETNHSPTTTGSKRPPSAGSASAGGVSTPVSTARPIGNTDGLAPFRLLRKSATSGNFTIANILNAEEDSDSSSNNGKNNGEATYTNECESGVDEQNDPIIRGLVSHPTAQGLFER